MRRQVIENKRLIGIHGEKVGMMGVIQDCWGRAEPADVWSIHGTSGPQHTQSISLNFSFLEFHCSSRSTKLHVPLVGHKYLFTVIHTTHIGCFGYDIKFFVFVFVYRFECLSLIKYLYIILYHNSFKEFPSSNNL